MGEALSPVQSLSFGPDALSGPDQVGTRQFRLLLQENLVEK